MSRVVFERTLTRFLNTLTGRMEENEQISALIYTEGFRTGYNGVAGEHHVLFETAAQKNGTDGLSLNGTYFQDGLDGDLDDMFCSEMFQSLTGLFPYEVRELSETKVNCVGHFGTLMTFRQSL